MSYRVRVNLKVVATKEYSKLLKFPEQEPHHQLSLMKYRGQFFVGTDEYSPIQGIH